ncbi:MAG: hypothetical protein H6728_09155 [Myxococcales bacterium]|nr:hypothetical protein [Myxococcales bacterium]MCB9643231.1 hypothetical protein [Myxococcales bacterium]
MFATAHNLSFFDLAWQGTLHRSYSLGLLLYFAFVLWWFFRQQRQLRHQARELQTQAETSLQRLQALSFPSEQAAWPAFLREHGLYELANSQETGHALPAFESIQQRWLQRTLPTPTKQPLETTLLGWPPVAIGLCGTLLGLLYQTTAPWTSALWPAFVGLVASLVGISLQHLLVRAQHTYLQSDAQQRQQHTAWLDKLCGHLPVPRKTRGGVQILEGLQRSVTQLLEAQANHPTQDLMVALTQQQEQNHQQLEQIVEGIQQLNALPERLHLLTEPLERADQSLQTWCSTLDQMDEKLQRFSRVLAEGLEPIAHSERLLSERIAALSRHYVALSDMLERIEQHERLLPQRTADLMKLSLRPAHQLLQRASLSLVRLLEQALNQQTREREGWRRLMGELNERLNSFDRLTHTHEKMNHELSNIADNLTELSTQIRFRPIIPTLNQEDTQNMSEALETEIEQLLNEGFQDIQAPPPHDPS